MRHLRLSTELHGELIYRTPKHSHLTEQCVDATKCSCCTNALLASQLVPFMYDFVTCNE